MLGGAQLREIQSFVVQHFDVGELRALLRTHLDVDLGEVAAPGDLGDRAWDVVLWAERVGRTGELLRAISTERPNWTGQDMEPQRAFQEGNGVQRTVGQLEQGMVQVNERLQSMEEQIRFLRWWVTVSVLLNGILGTMLTYHTWAG